MASKSKAAAVLAVLMCDVRCAGSADGPGSCSCRCTPVEDCLDWRYRIGNAVVDIVNCGGFSSSSQFHGGIVLVGIPTIPIHFRNRPVSRFCINTSVVTQMAPFPTVIPHATPPSYNLVITFGRWLCF